MKKIFISTTSFGEFSNEPIKLLKSQNFEVTLNDLGRRLQKSDCIELFGDYDGIIAGTEEFDSTVLDKALLLKVISRVGVGLDNIDIKYAHKKKIKVYNTKCSPALAVAELVIGLMIDSKRYITLHNLDMKKNIWKKRMGTLLSGKTLGIIGLGNIGKTLVKITKGFSLKYLAYDRIIDSDFAKNYNVEYCDLNNLLENSELISIHLNLTNENKNLISNNQLRLIKPETIVINTSRSEIINEKSLISSLSKKQIQYVCLDVHSSEPYSGPLSNFDNVILTPHIGSYAKESRISMELEATKNLIKGFEIK